MVRYNLQDCGTVLYFRWREVALFIDAFVLYIYCTCPAENSCIIFNFSTSWVFLKHDDFVSSVIYHNQLTDAFFSTVLRLMSDPPEKTMYVAMEKR